MAGARVAVLWWLLPLRAEAHAFDDRYDLPAPLTYFVAAAAAVVLSFVVAACFAGAAPPAESRGRELRVPGVLSLVRLMGSFLSVTVLFLTMAAGFAGTRDPMMNVVPTLVWIVWWVGLSMIVACIGNVWPTVDPWRNLYRAADFVLRRAGRSAGADLGMKYPAAVGRWPAVLLLLAFGWFELVYPEAANPYRIAWVAAAWTVVTLAGMACFGADVWQRNVDVFAVYFGILGRFAPLAPGSAPRSIVLRMPGSGLIGSLPEPPGTTAFVMAMLSITLFDGLLSGSLWKVVEHALTGFAPWLKSRTGHGAGAAGLAGLWLAFLAAYLSACWMAARFRADRSALAAARAFALAMVPIAVGYNVAHNFTYLAIQGQQIIPLLSDPLGRSWDLFGTAGYRADIGIFDARLTWYVAMAAIVAGHVSSIWLAHRVALREFGAPRRAVLASLPLTGLMVAFTIASLSVIAEPMVKFGINDENASAPPPGLKQAGQVSAEASRRTVVDAGSDAAEIVPAGTRGQSPLPASM